MSSEIKIAPTVRIENHTSYLKMVYQGIYIGSVTPAQCTENGEYAAAPMDGVPLYITDRRPDNLDLNQLKAILFVEAAIRAWLTAFASMWQLIQSNEVQRAAIQLSQHWCYLETTAQTE